MGTPWNPVLTIGSDSGDFDCPQARLCCGPPPVSSGPRPGRCGQWAVGMALWAAVSPQSDSDTQGNTGAQMANCGAAGRLSRPRLSPAQPRATETQAHRGCRLWQKPEGWGGPTHSSWEIHEKRCLLMKFVLFCFVCCCCFRFLIWRQRKYQLGVLKHSNRSSKLMNWP